MKKETAIEWLLNEIKKSEVAYGVFNLDDYGKIFQEAKDLEQKQIEKAVIYGNQQDFYDATETLGRKYYNEMYVEKNNLTRYAERFGIPINDILCYASGSYHDTITVKTIESAKKVSNKVNSIVIEGGIYDGKKMGDIFQCSVSEFEVTC